jgi:tetratricopeptide (TPR) repeat protein
MRKLHALAAAAQEASNQQDHASARQQFAELLRQLTNLNLKSGWSHWGLAISHDYLGESEMALNEMRKSLALDPLNPSAHHSFGIIVRRLRDQLAQAPIEDASVARLYGLLQESGECDVPTHLVMARHLAATARVERATELVAALCLTAPASQEVWAERARLARLQGDLTAAAEFEAEAQVRKLPDVPFSIPSRSEG